MAQQTAVDLFMAYVSKHKEFLGYDLDEVYKQAKQIESDRRKEDFKIGYNHGFLDAKLNHVNDADNLAKEYNYLNNTNE